MKQQILSDKNVKAEIDKFILVLKENNIPVDKIILYGSYAKQTPKSYSDIDLAVVSTHFGKNEIEEMMLLSKLSWQASDRIESIPLTPKHLDMHYHPLIGEIKKYGKVVYEK